MKGLMISFFVVFMLFGELACAQIPLSEVKEKKFLDKAYETSVSTFFCKMMTYEEEKVIGRTWEIIHDTLGYIYYGIPKSSIKYDLYIKRLYKVNKQDVENDFWFYNDVKKIYDMKESVHEFIFKTFKRQEKEEDIDLTCADPEFELLDNYINVAVPYWPGKIPRRKKMNYLLFRIDKETLKIIDDSKK